MKAAQAKLRSLVSKKKRRFQEGDFDLDLTYVTDRLIAMGFPSEGGEGIYRNPMGEVVRFFQSKHPDCHRIYNLCSEREYDPQRFSHQVVRFPFDDHNPPTLRLMVECCQDIHNWLNQNPKNVAAIHCKAGKGRTGVMISSFLLFTEQFSTPQEALDAFGKSRTRDGKGVTIPSQRRFVGYFDRLLHDYYCAGLPQIDFNFDGKPVALTRVRFSSLPRFEDGGCQPYFLVRSFAGKTLYDSRVSLGKPKHYKYQQPIEFDLGVNHRAILRAEFKVMFFHQALAGDKEMLHFWLHSEYVPTKEPLVIVKDELDRARKDKEHKRFSPTFEVSLLFEDYNEQQASDPAQAIMSDDDIAVSLRRLAEHFQDQKKRVESEQRTAIELSSHNVKLQHQLRTLQEDHRAALKSIERLKMEKEALENDYKLARNLIPADVRLKLDAQKRHREQLDARSAGRQGDVTMFAPPGGISSAPSTPSLQALPSSEFPSDDEDDEPGFEGYEMPVPVLPPPAPPAGMSSGPRPSAAALIGLPLSPTGAVSEGPTRSASQPPTLQEARDAQPASTERRTAAASAADEAPPLPSTPPPALPADADDGRPRRQ